MAQAAAFGVSGRVGFDTFVATLPLTALSSIALFIGMIMQRRFRPETYMALLRWILWAMAILLLLQSARGLLP